MKICDKQASVAVINSGATRDMFMQSCLREIQFFAAKGEFEIRAVHCPGVENRIPDVLSRWGSGSAVRKTCYDLTEGVRTQEVTILPSDFQFSHDW